MEYKLKDIKKGPVRCKLGAGKSLSIKTTWAGDYRLIYYKGMPSKDTFEVSNVYYPVATKKIERLDCGVILEDIVVSPKTIKFTMRADLKKIKSLHIDSAWRKSLA